MGRGGDGAPPSRPPPPGPMGSPPQVHVPSPPPRLITLDKSSRHEPVSDGASRAATEAALTGYDSLRETAQSLIEHHMQARGNMEYMQTRLDDQAETIDSQSREIGQLKSEMAARDATAAAQDESIKNLKTSWDLAEMRGSQLQAKADALRDRLDEALGALEGAQMADLSTREELEKLRELLVEAEARVAESRSAAARAEETAMKAHTAAQVASDERVGAEKQAEAAEAARVEMKESLASLVAEHRSSAKDAGTDLEERGKMEALLREGSVSEGIIGQVLLRMDRAAIQAKSSIASAVEESKLAWERDAESKKPVQADAENQTDPIPSPVLPKKRSRGVQTMKITSVKKKTSSIAVGTDPQKAPEAAPTPTTKKKPTPAATGTNETAESGSAPKTTTIGRRSPVAAPVFGRSSFGGSHRRSLTGRSPRVAKPPSLTRSMTNASANSRLEKRLLDLWESPTKSPFGYRG